MGIRWRCAALSCLMANVSGSDFDWFDEVAAPAVVSDHDRVSHMLSSLRRGDTFHVGRSAWTVENARGISIYAVKAGTSGRKLYAVSVVDPREDLVEIVQVAPGSGQLILGQPPAARGPLRVASPRRENPWHPEGWPEWPIASEEMVDGFWLRSPTLTLERPLHQPSQVHAFIWRNTDGDWFYHVPGYGSWPLEGRRDPAGRVRLWPRTIPGLRDRVPVDFDRGATATGIAAMRDAAVEALRRRDGARNVAWGRRMRRP